MTSACQVARMEPHDEGAGTPVPCEEDPAPPAARPARVGTPAPLARLLAAASAEERRRLVGERVAAIGCDWLVYARMAGTEPACPVPLYTVDADPQWLRRYADEGWHAVDPRLQDAARTWLPFAWTLADLEGHAQGALPSSPLRRFVADLAATGMRGGAVLVLPGEGGGDRHVVSLMARAPSRRLVDGELIGEVLALGICLHECLARHPVQPRPPVAAASLTPVQREILGHVARGESDKRIAHHLRISSHAVDYHMRQLRHRFAVHNRVQLAQASRGIVS